MNLDALKDLKTTLPGLAMICLTVIIVAGKLDVNALVKDIPWQYVLGLLFGGGGAALLGANSSKISNSSNSSAGSFPQTPPVKPGPAIPPGLPVDVVADCAKVNPPEAGQPSSNP